MGKPLILVVNDDGIFAPGISALVESVEHLGEVVVVSPDTPQSGKGHALTISEILRYNRDTKIFKDVEAYSCTGTPVDCVKMAKHVILKGRTIDLCVSGINHGSNSAINIIYSGTMAAAMEASLENIPSVGFSLLDYSFEADFLPARPYIEKIAGYVMSQSDKSLLFNVNIPKLKYDEIKGVKLCRQANAIWKEHFKEGRDPANRPYFWLTGEFVNLEPDAMDTDVWALANGFLSAVPSMPDLTDYKRMATLQNNNFETIMMHSS